jgi:hypothetical protein
VTPAVFMKDFAIGAAVLVLFTKETYCQQMN